MHRSVLEQLAGDTWGRLRDAAALGVRFGEETITDLLLLDLKRRGLRGLQVIQTSKYAEKSHGTDFEWWIGSDAFRWLRFAVQAKRMQLKGRYPGITHKVGGLYQIDLLEAYAAANGARPLYCFYNYTVTVDEAKHWHCCRCYAPDQLGVSIAPASTVRATLGVFGTKNFDAIHSDSRSLPWRCLFNCPRSKAFIRGMSTEHVDLAPIYDLLGGDRNSFARLPPEISAARESGHVLQLRGAAEDEFGPKRILIVELDRVPEFW